MAEHGYTPELHRASGQFARLMVTTMFAVQLQAVARLTIDDVAEYGVSPDALEDVRRRLVAWHAELTTPKPRAEANREAHERVDPISRIP